MSHPQSSAKSSIQTAESLDAGQNPASCPVTPGKGTACGDVLWQPPALTRKFILQVLALAAVWSLLAIVQGTWASVVIALVMLTWLFGCPRTKRASISVAICLYLPFVWLLAMDYPWNDYRWFWLEKWGVIPGIPPGHLVWSRLGFPGGEGTLDALSGALTFALFLSAVTVIRFWPRGRWPVLILVSGLAVVFSVAAYHIMRA